MAGDGPQRALRLKLHEPAGDIPVARPVEAEPAHPELLHPFRRHCIEGVARGNRGMEAGFEGGHEGHARQLLPQQPHRLDVGGIVGRSDLAHLLHRRQYVGGDTNDAAHSPAMHRLESNRRHFVDARERPTVAGELLESRPEGDGVIGDRHHRLDVIAAGAGIDPTFGGTDPLHAPARQLLLAADRGPIGEVVKPVLEARGAEVGDEDDHRSFLRNPLGGPVVMPWPGPFRERAIRGQRSCFVCSAAIVLATNP